MWAAGPDPAGQPGGRQEVNSRAGTLAAGGPGGGAGHGGPGDSLQAAPRPGQNKSEKTRP